MNYSKQYWGKKVERKIKKADRSMRENNPISAIPPIKEAIRHLPHEAYFTIF